MLQSLLSAQAGIADRYETAGPKGRIPTDQSIPQTLPTRQNSHGHPCLFFAFSFSFTSYRISFSAKIESKNRLRAALFTSLGQFWPTKLQSPSDSHFPAHSTVQYPTPSMHDPSQAASSAGQNFNRAVVLEGIFVSWCYFYSFSLWQKYRCWDVWVFSALIDTQAV